MNTHPTPAIWWTHRRRHSYISLGGLFGIGLAAVVINPEQLVAASPILTTIGWAFGAIILSYIGAATLDDIVALRNSK